MNDDHPGPRPASGYRPDVLGGLTMGMGFYSRLPVGAATAVPALDGMAPLLGVTSLAIGVGPAVLVVVLTLLGLPGIFAAGLAVILLLALTGAMAEDALADAADGLFGGVTATRRLEIMRDSRHGTYGVLALVIFVLLRIVAVGAISAAHWLGVAGAWLAAMIVARSGSIWLAVVLPPARTDGLSAAVGAVSTRSFAVGAVVAAVLAGALAMPVAGALGLVVAALLVVAVIAGWTLLCRRLVGGQTGDLIGALQALLELAVLTVLLAFA